MRLPNLYTCRYILANGDPRQFTVSADNRSDAAAKAEREAREALGDQFAAARCEGVELKQRRVLMFAADGDGRIQKILTQVSANGTVLS